MPVVAGDAGGADPEFRAVMSAGPRRGRVPDRLPKAVVFDMDGLMLDTERLERELWRTVVARRGGEFPDSLYAALVGRRESDSAPTLREHLGAGFALEEARAEVRKLWRERTAVDGAPLKPGLHELLNCLEASSLPTAVATSTARERALESLGPLAMRFAVLCFGDEVVHGKPEPDIYRLAAARLTLEPRDCLALEDSPAGLAAAEAAGMPAILIPDLVEPEVEPRYRLESLAEVTAWLRPALEACPTSADSL